ncbi:MULTISPECIES: Na+/H+ antiporter [Streptomyces]|uniref:Na+/H+ antiporter n=1 Tax=Streptomyces tsukubensis (strain DSM 42081 / NBRC 108919 / NRRL 18488 / 9993) TaxID=1114943 RepID=I2N5X6_STRT9|nr:MULTISPECIES: Na+/H+ antiporter [Streptomyces]AZK96431.1 Na+/H+ antiporter [Streptomyces tsukubensis]EIF92423.1 Na+/H+ antiporter [Streptomyces tsukubensis NRRL18488]MYS67775.1 Na+/H+ antiporter [Streptomyces sp. SID5473]QKM67566.1 Na+/H+ antiporter [Streptomyces tsukubensis NRRL18488]TAI43961.1 Na+/H+ antiporter [Streptomyces tsukubensis]
MEALSLVALIAVSAAVAGAARRTRVPAPLLLVAAGLVASYLPGVPDYTLDPHIVLPLVLPPLLHTAALDSSYLDLRANIRPVALLSFGYTLFATVAVGWLAYLLIPQLPLTAALVLGAVVAPPDAVAATAIARRLGLPHRITTILQGESLINDATAITAYRVAVAAAVGEGASWLGGMGEFAVAALGGVAVGLALMVPIHWLRTRLREPLLQNTLSLLIPFVAYAAAEQVHASGVLAVVVVALYLGHRSWQVDFATRLQEAAVWRMVAFVLESAVFALIGLQLSYVLRGLGDYGVAQALGYGVGVFVLVVAVRFVWVFPATFLPRISPRIRAREPEVTWKAPLVVGWAGMRGVVSLAIAFSIPLTTAAGEPFPSRNLVLFLTFTTVIGTLVVQGLTLPALIRALRLPRPDPFAETLAEAEAQNAASEAAERKLDALLADERNALPEPLEERLRTVMERRRNSVWERLGAVNEATGESADETYRRLAREMIGAERAVFVQLRDARRIDDEMMRTLLFRLDLEEAAAYREEDAD